MVMVKKDALYPTKQIELPGIEGSIVVMKTRQSVGENRALLEEYPGMGDETKVIESQKASYKMLTNCIVSWNLEDENGPWPVDVEHIEMLPSDAYTALLAVLTPEDQKKK